MKRATLIAKTTVLILFALRVPALTAVAQISKTQQQVVKAVRYVWHAKGANQQVDAAQALRDIVLATDPITIDDRTIHTVASLLVLQNDATRYWVVEALGHFGSRARFVSPTLLRILNQRECMISETSSAPMIRDTLEQIGTPAPDRKCDHYLLPH